MTIEQQKKLNAHIFRLLKVTEIVIPIGRTNKGNLGLKFTQNDDDFEIFLDAVPLSVKDMLADDNNIELKKILTKYLFQTESPTYIPSTKKKSGDFVGKKGDSELDQLKDIVDDSTTHVNVGKITDAAGNDRTDELLRPAPKKRGRPAKAK